MAERVLIVDDDTRLSAMLSDYLSGNGYTVHTAATATAGIAELGRRTPDVVILDVMLPDFDGFETCRRIRAVSDVPDLDAHGQRRGDGPHRRAGARGRRLSAQALQSARAAGAAEGDPAPPQRQRRALRGPFASDRLEIDPRFPLRSGSTAANVR